MQRNPVFAIIAICPLLLVACHKKTADSNAGAPAKDASGCTGRPSDAVLAANIAAYQARFYGNLPVVVVGVRPGCDDTFVDYRRGAMSESIELIRYDNGDWYLKGLSGGSTMKIDSSASTQP